MNYNFIKYRDLKEIDNEFKRYLLKCAQIFPYHKEDILKSCDKIQQIREQYKILIDNKELDNDTQNKLINLLKSEYNNIMNILTNEQVINIFNNQLKHINKLLGEKDKTPFINDINKLYAKNKEQYELLTDENKDLFYENELSKNNIILKKLKLWIPMKERKLRNIIKDEINEFKKELKQDVFKSTMKDTKDYITNTNTQLKKEVINDVKEELRGSTLGKFIKVINTKLNFSNTSLLKDDEKVLIDNFNKMIEKYKPLKSKFENANDTDKYKIKDEIDKALYDLIPLYEKINKLINEYDKRYNYYNAVLQHRKEISELTGYKKNELEDIKKNIISDQSKYYYLDNNNIIKNLIKEYKGYLIRVNKRIEELQKIEDDSNIYNRIKNFIDKFAGKDYLTDFKDFDNFTKKIKLEATNEEKELFKKTYDTIDFRDYLCDKKQRAQWTAYIKNKLNIDDIMNYDKSLDGLEDDNNNNTSSNNEDDNENNNNSSNDDKDKDDESETDKDDDDANFVSADEGEEDDDKVKGPGPNVYKIEMTKYKSIKPDKINKKIYELYYKNNNKDIDGILYLLFKKYYEELEPKEAKKKIMKLLYLFDRKYRLDKFNSRKNKKFYKSDYFESDKFNNKVEQIKGSGILSSILGAIGLNANVLNARGSGLISGLIGGLFNGVKSLFGGNAECLNGIDYNKLKQYNNEVQDGILHYILKENNKNLNDKELFKLFKDCLMKYDKENRIKIFNKRINNKFYDDKNLNKVVGGFPALLGLLAPLVPSLINSVGNLIGNIKGKNNNSLNYPSGSSVMTIKELENIKKNIK